MLRSKTNLPGFCVILFLLTILATIGHAQFRAGVQGTVTDTGGGTVGGASVTLTNKETKETKTTQTSTDGFYRFDSLSPGLYSVTVEQPGFKKRIVDDVKVEAESVKGQDVVLEAGVISETVTVTAEPAPLETEDANIRKNITTEEVLRLPQVGRDPYELARLAPGVVRCRCSRFGRWFCRFAKHQRTRGFKRIHFPNGESAARYRQRPTRIGQQLPDRRHKRNSQTWGGAAVITPKPGERQRGSGNLQHLLGRGWPKQRCADKGRLSKRHKRLAWQRVLQHGRSGP